MSAREVLVTVRELLEDDERGLRAQAERVVQEIGLGLGSVRTDYGWDRWVLRGQLLQASPRWSVAPAAYEANGKHAAKTERDARVVLAIRGSVVDADPSRLEDWLLVHTQALLDCLDALEEYSRTVGGTIALVEDPARIEYGSFTSTATEAGLECTVSLLERSAL